MGVERVDYYSDEEYEQALQGEAQSCEPPMCQCEVCGGAMYDDGTGICSTSCAALVAEKDNA